MARRLSIGMVGLLTSLCCLSGTVGANAWADGGSSVNGEGRKSEVFLSAIGESSGSSQSAVGEPAKAPVDQPIRAAENYTYQQVRYSPMCRTGGAPGCAQVRNCPGGTPRYGQFTRTVEVSGGSETAGPWSFDQWTCLTDSGVASTGPAPLPQVTWQVVLREVESIGLPSLEVQVEPADKTLVNFATNFYATPEAFERQVSLLGRSVDVRADPVGFAWTFGDGESTTTQGPGGAYPDLQVTHEYADADVTVHPSVDVTYEAQFRVDGGTWQTIPETVTIAGTPVALRVVEATPVLSGRDG